jgi:hypothetical protein
MKRIQLLILATAAFLLGHGAHGALVLVEQVDYDASGTFGAAADTGTLNGWQNAKPELQLTNGSGSLIGTNLGLAASVDDRVFISNVPRVDTSTTRNEFARGLFLQTVETNLYYSFLYKFVNAADVDATGELIMRANRGNSGSTSAQHWDLIARNVGGQIQIGITKAAGNVTNYAATNINIGETIFVVVRQHIIPGIENDIYDLWINPPSDSFAVDEGSIPPSLASVGAATTDGAEDQSSTGVGRVAVFPGVNSEFDEFRIATTWAEATPAVGQCLTATIITQPVSVSQSAELAATFTVDVGGSSPTIQWQMSTNSGTTWVDIPDATVSIYRTPNLPLSASGNQYRAIVSVACDASSVTSAVATVTLTAPTPTPIGSVMFDTFLDPDLGYDSRGNQPVTPSNSVWFSATDESVPGLVAYGQGGNLVGTPMSGSSSLWLGYFTDTNVPPVHLSVGRSIKVRLPFTVGDFYSFTGNGSVRFGLFNYYDGGTRVTVDGPAASGSQGQGAQVRGYMMNLNFGTNFTDTTPLELFGRTILTDTSLMGSTGSYESLASGPEGGVATNTPSFQTGTEYTLEFLVTRTAFSSVDVTATITTPTTNWSVSVTDDYYAYHRFDAFGLRPNNLEGTSSSFTFPEFEVTVEQAVLSVPSFRITEVRRLATDSVKLTWESVGGATYHVLSQDTLTGAVTTNATVVATGSSTSYTNAPIPGTVTERFYQVVAPPYTP